jgi:hypothetical protein
LSLEREIRPSFSSGTPSLSLLFSLRVQDRRRAQGRRQHEEHHPEPVVPELAGRVEPDGGGAELLVGEAGAVVVEPGSSFDEITILCNIPQQYTVRVCELLLLTAMELDECEGVERRCDDDDEALTSARCGTAGRRRAGRGAGIPPASRRVWRLPLRW